MEVVKGTKQKENYMDQPKKCDSCGKMFYAPYKERVWVECPYCKKLH